MCVVCWAMTFDSVYQAKGLLKSGETDVPCPKSWDGFAISNHAVYHVSVSEGTTMHRNSMSRKANHPYGLSGLRTEQNEYETKTCLFLLFIFTTRSFIQKETSQLTVAFFLFPQEVSYCPAVAPENLYLMALAEMSGDTEAATEFARRALSEKASDSEWLGGMRLRGTKGDVVG